MAYTATPAAAKPTTPTTAPTVCGPGSGAARRTDPNGSDFCDLGAQPPLLVDPHRQRRHHDQRREEGDRHVQGDDQAEVPQQWQCRSDQHGEATDRGDRRGEEGAARTTGSRVRCVSWRQPALAFLQVAPEDQDGELGTARDHQRSTDRGQRAQGEAEQPDDQRRDADRQQHGHEGEQGAGEAAEPQHEEQPGKAQRQIRQVGPVRREVLEQADADGGEPGRRRPAPLPGPRADRRAGCCRDGSSSASMRASRSASSSSTQLGSIIETRRRQPEVQLSRRRVVLRPQQRLGDVVGHHRVGALDSGQPVHRRQDVLTRRGDGRRAIDHDDLAHRVDHARADDTTSSVGPRRRA